MTLRRLPRIDIRPLKGLLERVVPTSWWQECLLENCTPRRGRVLVAHYSLKGSIFSNVGQGINTP